MNETHDPSRRSWEPSANVAGTDFPIQNLPFGVFRRSSDERPRIGVAIGARILDLAQSVSEKAISGEGAHACTEPSLNALMSLGPVVAGDLRAQLSALLSADDASRPSDSRLRERLLVRADDVELLVPAQIGDYTDFYASIHHATNVGSLFRPDNPLLPNYKWVPIGYHGRASSIVPSGAPIQRPSGQRKDPGDAPPRFEPSRSLDYEMELGVFVARGNEQGSTIPIGDVNQHLFGMCIVNDWSARDIQSWEYQPLGPFLGKSFATTVSPWIVTMQALEPFRVAMPARPDGDPAPLPYLSDAGDAQRGAIDIRVEVSIETRQMRERGLGAFRVSESSFATMYWTIAQMLAHHASNGCNLRPGDLLASGTISGPEPESRGCLLERTWRGKEPLTLPSGETRAFLEDGDMVVMRAWCERDGAVRIGFGPCSGEIVGAR